MRKEKNNNDYSTSSHSYQRAPLGVQNLIFEMQDKMNKHKGKGRSWRFYSSISFSSQKINK